MFLFLLMYKRVITFTVALLLLMTFVSAVQVTDIAQGLENNSAEINSLKADLTIQLTQMNNKLDKFATAQDMTNLLTGHLQKTNEIMDWFRSILIVSFIVIGLSFLGLGYSIYFYFKSKGRL